MIEVRSTFIELENVSRDGLLERERWVAAGGGGIWMERYAFTSLWCAYGAASVIILGHFWKSRLVRLFEYGRLFGGEAHWVFTARWRWRIASTSARSCRRPEASLLVIRSAAEM